MAISDANTWDGFSGSENDREENRNSMTIDNVENHPENRRRESMASRVPFGNSVSMQRHIDHNNRNRGMLDSDDEDLPPSRRRSRTIESFTIESPNGNETLTINCLEIYDVRDEYCWTDAQVLRIYPDRRVAYITYLCWGDKYDREVPLDWSYFRQHNSMIYSNNPSSLRSMQYISILPKSRRTDEFDYVPVRSTDLNDTKTIVTVLLLNPKSQMSIEFTKHMIEYRNKNSSRFNLPINEIDILPYRRRSDKETLKVKLRNLYRDCDADLIPNNVRHEGDFLLDDDENEYFNSRHINRQEASSSTNSSYEGKRQKYPSERQDAFSLHRDSRHINRQEASSSTNSSYEGKRQKYPSERQDAFSLHRDLSVQQKKVYESVIQRSTPGFVKQEVEKDGNCLFRSVSVLIYGTEDHHSKIRDYCCDFILMEREFFQNFIFDYSVDEYLNGSYRIAGMRENRTWGGDVELNAICKLYQRRPEITTYNPISNRPYKMNIPMDQNFEGEPLRLSYLNRHYEPFVPTRNTSPFPRPGEIELNVLAIGPTLNADGRNNSFIHAQYSIQGQYNDLWTQHEMSEDYKEDDIDIHQVKKATDNEYVEERMVREMQDATENEFLEKQILSQVQEQSKGTDQYNDDGFVGIDEALALSLANEFEGMDEALALSIEEDQRQVDEALARSLYHK